MNSRDVVLAFIDAWNRVDMEGVYALMAPDIVYHNIPMPPATGLDAAKAVIASFPPFNACEWIVHHIAEAGNVVLTERTDRFRIGDTWIALPVMGTFEVKDGSIKAWRDYFDLQQFMSQIPAPPAA
jgi:limonene-1,2-epoxide hydrolase